MRMIQKYTLKEGVGRINVPSTAVVVFGACDCDGAVCVYMETDTVDLDRMELAFLVVKVGAEIEGNMVLDYIGHACLPSGDVLVIYEIL